MKKMKSFRWMVLPLFLGCFFLWVGDAFSSEEAGRVLSVKRDVYLIRGAEKNIARAQSPLLPKDAVLTEEKARTKLFFSDDSILNMGELSQVVVEEYLFASEKEREKSIYRLVDGSLKVVVGKSELEIHTPTAVAAARGTKFIIWVEGTGEAATTGLIVLEGEVAFRNIHDAVKGIQSIQRGQMSRVSAGRPPGPAAPTDAGTLSQYNGGTQAIGSVFKDNQDRVSTSEKDEEDNLPRSVRNTVNVAKTPPVTQVPVPNLTIKVEWHD